MKLHQVNAERLANLCDRASRVAFALIVILLLVGAFGWRGVA